MPEWNGSYYVAPVSVPDREPDEPYDYDDEPDDEWYRERYTRTDHELEKQKARRDDNVHHDGTPRERVKKGE